MPFDYATPRDAIDRDGLRLVVVGEVPSPWSEAAKGLLHVKGIDWTAVRLVYDSEPLKQWAGQRSAPVAIYGKEPPRSGWREILMLAERLAPSPSLLPDEPDLRGPVLALAQEICGTGGLGWSRRLQLIHAGLQGTGGFSARVASYLGKKYGYSPEAGAASSVRVVQLLNALAARLKAQRDRASRYLVGQTLTAADVYSATFMALFAPLAHAQCAMEAGTRAAFETRDAQTGTALDPILLEHRDMVYAAHLELPLAL